MGRAAVILFALAALAGASANAAPVKVEAEVPVTQPGASQFVVHSDRLGRDFQITVSLPSATAFLPGQKLPAIYALDGGYDLAGPHGQFLSNRGAMTPAVIVSIGYLPGQAHMRGVDLAHKAWTPIGGDFPATGGGGAAFEAFLLEDLRPLIEARYPVDPKRSVLFGHSLGGLFAANVFADRPDAFAAYIMGSVSVWVEPGVVARVKAAAPRATGQRVFLSVGEFEDAANGLTHMRRGFEDVAAALANGRGVVLKTQVYPDENHISYYPRLVLDSFPFVLPGVWSKTSQQKAMTPETLARYVGTYRLPDGREIAIRATPQGQLTAQVTGIAVVPLLQNGRDRFYAPTSDIDVVFDDKGANLSGGGAELRIEKAS